MPALMADMTYADAEAARAGDPVVLLPVGSTEAHGPHLPLGTDVIISEELARRAGRALEVGRPAVPTLIAPSLAYAVTEYAAEFAGTVSIPAASACALLRDVCRGIARQGFRRICLVNSHLEPAHAAGLRQAVREVGLPAGPSVAFPDVLERRWGRTLSDEYKRGACHAGSYETSLVLASRPELVRDAARAGLPARDVDLAKAMRAGVRTFKEAGAVDAYFGDPAAATRVEGEDLYLRLVDMVVTVVRETWPERFA